MDILKRLIAAACLAVLLVMSLSVNGLAAQTVLTTVVPEKMTLHLEIAGSGQVFYKGSCYNRSTTLTVLETDDVEFLLQPSKGWKIARVTYNGVNQRFHIQGNVLTLKELQLDSVLTVTFAAKGGNPDTGDSAPVPAAFITAALSLMVLLLLLRKRIA